MGVVGIIRASLCVASRRVRLLSLFSEWKSTRGKTTSYNPRERKGLNPERGNDLVKLPHSLTTPGRSSRAPLKRTNERAIESVVSSFAVVFCRFRSVDRLRVKGKEIPFVRAVRSLKNAIENVDAGWVRRVDVDDDDDEAETQPRWWI